MAIFALKGHAFRRAAKIAGSDRLLAAERAHPQGLKAGLLIARIGAAETAPFQGGYSNSEIALGKF